jgi:hypothetical protein
MSGRSRGRALLLVLLVLCSTIGAVAIPALAGPGNGNGNGNGNGQATSPAGLTSVPSSNVRDGARGGINASAADFRGSVMSSVHAESTEITVLSASRVLGPDGKPVGGSGEIALKISDDVNHEGRTVGVPMGVIRRNLGGTIPERVHGIHSSGDRWSAPITRSGGLLIFRVPKFSSNTVTFSGRVEINGQPSMSGSQYIYQVSSLDAVADYWINVTGIRATETDTESGIVTDGGTLPVSIAGNADPIGSEVRLTGVETTGSWTASGTDATGGLTSSITVDGNVDPRNATITFEGNRSTASGSASGTGATSTTSSTISVGGNEPPESVSVTFDGRETLQSASASGSNRNDGQTASVSVGGDGTPKNVDVTFSGDTVSTSRNPTGSASDGQSESISVGGNIDPTGPSANNNPELTITGREKNSTQFDGSSTVNTLDFAGHNGLGYQYQSEFYLGDKAPATITKLHFPSITTSDGTFDYVDVNIYIASGNKTNSGSITFDGTKVASGVRLKPGSKTIDISDYAPANPSNGVTIEVERVGNGYEDAVEIRVEQSGNGIFFREYDGSSSVQGAVPEVELISAPESVSVSSDDGTSVSYGSLSPGTTVTKEFDITQSATSLDFSMAGGEVDYSLSYDERTATEDPGVDVDGDGFDDGSHAGILTAGQTATVAVDAGDLSAGSNTLTFSTASGSRTDWTLDYDEAHWTTDPAVDLNSDGDADASFTGVIGPGGSEAISADAELVDGSNTADWSVTGPAPTDWSVSWTEVTAVEDPGVDVDGDGFDDASYLGTLDSGESVTESVTNLSSGAVTMDHSGAGAPYNWSMSAESVTHTEDPAVDVDGDSVNDMSVSGILAPGESVTKSVAMSRSTSSLAISTNAGSDVDVAATYTEVTESRDPTVEINGNTTSYAGTLPDGSTESLTTSESWIQNGTNTVNVTVSPGVSGDAPTGRVELDYSHKALDQQTVDAVAESWSERYNVSKTWAGSRENATLSVAMSDTVVEIRQLERSVNGSAYQAVSPSNYSLDGTTLTYDMGRARSSETVDLRINASKVRVDGGEIRVLDPTVPGNTLDTKIEIVNKTAGFYVDVSGTATGNYLHYADNVSWAGSDVYTEHEASGGQFIYAPNASAGSTLRVRTTDVEVLPQTGDVHVRLVNESATKLSISEGSSSGDAVKFRYHDTESGEEYALWSITNELQRDTATAESPVLLEDDDSSETLWIRLARSSTSSSSGGGGYSGRGGGSGPVSQDTGLLNSVPVVLGFGALAIGAVALLLRRFTSDRILQLGGTAVTAIVVLVGIGEAWAPGVVLGPVGESLGQVAPVIALIVAVVAAYGFYIRYIRGYTTIVEIGGKRLK